MHTRITRTVTTLAASAALVLAPTAPALAAGTDPAVDTHAATTLTVTGHGWGHGHGMAQYGAQGAARQGLTYAQILSFYYNGIPLSSTGGRVRVLITADTDNNLKIAAKAGLRVADLGNGRTYRLPMTRHPKAWRLNLVNGKTRVYYRTGRWHLFKTGGRTALAGVGEFRSKSGPMTLKLAAGDRQYRGALRFVSSDTVNVVSLEKYLRGVIPSEMPSTWLPAALQAQAVAARTYAARERADHASGYYDLCDTSRCQVYRGVVAEASSTDAAIAATAGKILTYGGKPAFAQFSSSNGGWTSTGSEPYLTAKPDPYDLPVDPVQHIGDPHHDWTVTVPIAKLQAAYPTIGTLTSIQIMTRDGSVQADQGWVLTIRLTGTSGSTTINGTDFKSVYGLNSSYFSLAAP